MRFNRIRKHFINIFFSNLHFKERQMDMLKTLPDVGQTFEISVDESKRPKECKNTFRVYKDISPDIMGKSGTFIKLNQDEI